MSSPVPDVGITIDSAAPESAVAPAVVTPSMYIWLWGRPPAVALAASSDVVVASDVAVAGAGADILAARHVVSVELSVGVFLFV